MYVFQMFDYYLGSRVLLGVCLAELIMMSYIYGKCCVCMTSHPVYYKIHLNIVIFFDFYFFECFLRSHSVL